MERLTSSAEPSATNSLFVLRRLQLVGCVVMLAAIGCGGEMTEARVKNAFTGVMGGLAVLVVVGFSVRRARRHAGRAADLALSIASQVAAGPIAARVLVEGRAVAGPNGPLQSPLTGATVVWYRVMVDEAAGSARKEVANASSSQAFFIDDGSGMRALIEPDDVYDDIPPVDLDANVTEALKRFLQAEGIQRNANKCSCAEHVVRPGQLVLAFGHARQMATTDTAAYRDAPVRQLVIGSGTFGEERQLLLSTKRKTSFVAGEKRKARDWYIRAAVGALFGTAWIAFAVHFAFKR